MRRYAQKFGFQCLDFARIGNVILACGGASRMVLPVGELSINCGQNGNVTQMSFHQLPV